MRTVSFDELSAIRPAEVVVTRTDQSRIVVSGPQTVGDTLLGYVNGQFEEIPASSLQAMQVKHRDKKKTAALVVAGLAGVAAMAIMVSGAGDHNNPEDTRDCEDDYYQPGCPGGPPLP
jgi:hypothetical protein